MSVSVRMLSFDARQEMCSNAPVGVMHLRKWYLPLIVGCEYEDTRLLY